MTPSDRDGFRPMTVQEQRERREYFRNKLLPVLLLQRRRKELGADVARQRIVL